MRVCLRIRRVALSGLAVLFTTIAPALLHAATSTATSTASASFGGAAGVGVLPAVTLNHSGTAFVSYTGSLLVSYRARTTGTGTGSLTMKVTSDFPSGGPSIGSPLPGDVLTYTCSVPSLGSGCLGNQTASTGSQTPVVSFGASACTGGGGACSASDPNTVTLTFTLPNDPQYKTGPYSATLTFTISAN